MILQRLTGWSTGGTHVGSRTIDRGRRPPEFPLWKKGQTENDCGVALPPERARPAHGRRAQEEPGKEEENKGQAVEIPTEVKHGRAGSASLAG